MTTITFTSIRTGAVTLLHSGVFRASRLDGVESAPPVNADTVDVAYQDGASLVTTRYTPRRITYEGRLTVATAALLRTTLDACKRDVSGDGYLDVALEGDTAEKRYRVHVMNVVAPAASYHVTQLPLTIVFEAHDPYGEDKAITSTLYENTAVSANIAANLTVLGSADGNVSIRIRGMVAGDTIVEIVNLRTSERFQTRNTWPADISETQSSAQLDINTAKRLVTLNGAPVDFAGSIPRFPPGLNPLQVNFLPGTGIDTQNLPYNRDYVLSDRANLGQTFTVHESGYILQRIDVLMQKRGQPGDVLWRLFREAYFFGDQPPFKLTPSFLAEGTLPSSAISESADWVPITIPNVNVLGSNNPYYLELSSQAAPDADNALIWKGTIDDVYVLGSKAENGSFSYDSGDLAFKVWKSTTVANLTADVRVQYKRRFL